MTSTETLLLAVYFFVLSILAIYGWHRYYLVYLYMKNKDKAPVPPPPLERLPPVTVQLPIFNEMYVADRLIGAVCELDGGVVRFHARQLIGGDIGKRAAVGGERLGGRRVSA